MGGDAKDPLDLAKGELRERLFGGEGTVRVWDLGHARLTPPFSAVLMAELAPAGRVGRHRQEHDHEVLVIVEGEGVLYVDGVAHASVRGSVVTLPLGAHLEIDNASITAPLRYLIVKARTEAPP